MIIGLCGPAGVGKTTAGEMLAEHYGCFHTSFAEPIREFVGQLLDGSQAADKEFVYEQLGVSRRQMYQTLGTEWGRQMVHMDLWVLALERRVKTKYDRERLGLDSKKEATNGLVISDVRFPNEALWVRQNRGLLIGLTRAGVQPVREHVSEAGVPPDLVVPNDGTTDELLARLVWEIDHE